MVKQRESLDLSAESGAYEIDAFAKRFETKSSVDERQKFETSTRQLRIGVNRMVMRARHRADRDSQQARRDAADLIAALAAVKQKLSPWLRRGRKDKRRERDPAEIAAELLPAFKGAPESPAPALVQIIESARSLDEWRKHLETFEVVAASAPASKPLPRRLAEGAAKLHKDRLGHMPKKTRDHWLADFLVAVCADFGLDGAENSSAYFGRKLQQIQTCNPKSKLKP
jgi:hypothetical protein